MFFLCFLLKGSLSSKFIWKLRHVQVKFPPFLCTILTLFLWHYFCLQSRSLHKGTTRNIVWLIETRTKETRCGFHALSCDPKSRFVLTFSLSLSHQGQMLAFKMSQVRAIHLFQFAQPVQNLSSHFASYTGTSTPYEHFKYHRNYRRWAFIHPTRSYNTE